MYIKVFNTEHSTITVEFPNHFEYVHSLSDSCSSVGVDIVSVLHYVGYALLQRIIFIFAEIG